MSNILRPDFVPMIVIIVVSLTFHEFGHSLVAIRLGDDTPRREGRLTLNPLAHIDWIGFFMMVFAGFGWAKPVRFDPRALAKPRRDETLIALAGPAANLMLALGLSCLLSLFLYAVSASRGAAPSQLAIAVLRFMALAVQINISLAIFNMLPIPPLDGSHLLTTWLARYNAALAVTFFRYGSWLLIALIVLERVTSRDILPVGRWTQAAVLALFRLVGIG
jgi:Zn-dependent protease